MPAGGDQRCIWTKHFDLFIGETELAHLLAWRLVLVAITVHSGLPALQDRVAGEECHLLRMPVSVHEAFEIAPIPGCRLIVQELSQVGVVALGEGGWAK